MRDPGDEVEAYHSLKVNGKYSLKLPLSLIFVDLHGTRSPNNIDTTGVSQLKIVYLCTRTMSFSAIFVHFDDRSLLAMHQTISEYDKR